MEQTLKVRIRVRQGERSVKQLLDDTRNYVRRAYGLLDSDGLVLTLEVNRKAIKAQITVDGSRQGTKWTIEQAAQPQWTKPDPRLYGYTQAEADAMLAEEIAAEARANQ